MAALIALAFALIVTAIVWLYFVWRDVVAAFDADPKTHTASEKIKDWRRKRGVLGYVLLGIPIGLIAVVGLSLSLYLLLHLELEIV